MVIVGVSTGRVRLVKGRVRVCQARVWEFNGRGWESKAEYGYLRLGCAHLRSTHLLVVHELEVVRVAVWLEQVLHTGARAGVAVRLHVRNGILVEGSHALTKRLRSA